MDVDAPSEETTGEISVAPLVPPPPPAPITVTNKQESAPVWSYPGEVYCVPHITTPLKEPCHGIYRNSNRETRLVSAVSLTSYIFARDSCVLRGNFVSTN